MKDENVTLILGGGPFDFLGMGWVILKKKSRLQAYLYLKSSSKRSMPKKTFTQV